MAAGQYDIYIEQGATYQLNCTYKDSSGSVIDLTGYTARMQIREKKSSTTKLLDISTSDYITLGGVAGTVVVEVPAATTAAMDFSRGVYDLELESSGGIVTRLLEGAVEFSKEVTR